MEGQATGFEDRCRVHVDQDGHRAPGSDSGPRFGARLSGLHEIPEPDTPRSIRFECDCRTDAYAMTAPRMRIGTPIARKAAISSQAVDMAAPCL
jgi:hypothetical protein